MIKKAVNEEIKIENEKNKSLDYISGLLEHLFKPTFTAFEYLGLSLSIVILLSVLFILFRSLTFKQAQASEIQELQKKNQDLNFDPAFIDSLENNQHYSQAIVYLHKCSIFYLLAQKIIIKKNLTNLALYGRIKDDELRKAFQDIYSLAEYIEFNEYSATAQDFSFCKNIFREYFMVKSS